MSRKRAASDDVDDEHTAKKHRVLHAKIAHSKRPPRAAQKAPYAVPVSQAFPLEGQPFTFKVPSNGPPVTRKRFIDTLAKRPEQHVQSTAGQLPQHPREGQDSHIQPGQAGGPTTQSTTQPHPLSHTPPHAADSAPEIKAPSISIGAKTKSFIDIRTKPAPTDKLSKLGAPIFERKPSGKSKAKFAPSEQAAASSNSSIASERSVGNDGRPPTSNRGTKASNSDTTPQVSIRAKSDFKSLSRARPSTYQDAATQTCHENTDSRRPLSQATDPDSMDPMSQSSTRIQHQPETLSSSTIPYVGDVVPRVSGTMDGVEFSNQATAPTISHDTPQSSIKSNILTARSAQPTTGSNPAVAQGQKRKVETNQYGAPDSKRARQELPAQLSRLVPAQKQGKHSEGSYMTSTQKSNCLFGNRSTESNDNSPKISITKPYILPRPTSKTIFDIQELADQVADELHRPFNTGVSNQNLRQTAASQRNLQRLRLVSKTFNRAAYRTLGRDVYFVKTRNFEFRPSRNEEIVRYFERRSVERAAFKVDTFIMNGPWRWFCIGMAAKRVLPPSDPLIHKHQQLFASNTPNKEEIFGKAWLARILKRFSGVKKLHLGVCAETMAGVMEILAASDLRITTLGYSETDFPMSEVCTIGNYLPVGSPALSKALKSVKTIEVDLNSDPKAPLTTLSQLGFTSGFPTILDAAVNVENLVIKNMANDSPHLFPPFEIKNGIKLRTLTLRQVAVGAGWLTRTLRNQESTLTSVALQDVALMSGHWHTALNQLKRIVDSGKLEHMDLRNLAYVQDQQFTARCFFRRDASGPNASFWSQNGDDTFGPVRSLNQADRHSFFKLAICVSHRKRAGPPIDSFFLFPAEAIGQPMTRCAGITGSNHRCQQERPRQAGEAEYRFVWVCNAHTNDAQSLARWPWQLHVPMDY